MATPADPRGTGARPSPDGLPVTAQPVSVCHQWSSTGTLSRLSAQATVSVSAPHAFNVGLNLGAVAGGSLADHLHQHVVPRWGGDANFIAVVGQTKVIPQLLSETRDLLADAWAQAARDEAEASTEGDRAGR